MAHGTNDQIIPVTASRGVIVPALRRDGFDVEYLEFAGPHTVTVEVARQASEWFVPVGPPDP